ncbi:hypothetical protein PMI01_00856, partial [Caulobacter sp. AP07]
GFSIEMKIASLEQYRHRGDSGVDPADRIAC